MLYSFELLDLFWVWGPLLVLAGFLTCGGAMVDLDMCKSEASTVRTYTARCTQAVKHKYFFREATRLSLVNGEIQRMSLVVQALVAPADNPSHTCNLQGSLRIKSFQLRLQFLMPSI